VADLSTATSGGSAVYVDLPGPLGTVISAAHCFDTRHGTVTCTFPDGQKVKATVKHLDYRRDIAILTIPRPQGINPVRMADVLPGKGEIATLIGHGGNPRRGFFAHAAYVQSGGGETIQVSSPSSQGDSGGCLLNARGQYLGVICRTSSLSGGPGSTYCAWVGPVRHLLGFHPNQQQQYQQQGYGGVAPVLPDTSNLVTRAEFEREMAAVRASILELQRMQTDGTRLEQRLEQVSLLLAKYKEEGAAAAYQLVRQYAIENFPPDVLARLGKIESAIGAIPAERRAEIVQGVVAWGKENIPADLIAAVRSSTEAIETIEADVETIEEDAETQADEVDAKIDAAEEGAGKKADLPLLATIATGMTALGGGGYLAAGSLGKNLLKAAVAIKD